MNNKINVKAISFAAAIVWAVVVALAAIWNSATGFGESFISMLSSLYAGIPSISQGAGFGANLWGILVLTVFSFVDAGLCALGVSLLYNWIASPKTPKKKKEEVVAGEEKAE